MTSYDLIFIECSKHKFKPDHVTQKEWDEFIIARNGKEIANEIDKEIIDNMEKEFRL